MNGRYNPDRMTAIWEAVLVAAQFVIDLWFHVVALFWLTGYWRLLTTLGQR